MKKNIVVVLALVLGLIIGAGGVYVATNNKVEQKSTVETVLKNGDYKVNGDGFKSATVKNGWLTMKNDKNVATKYFVVEANRKDNDIVVLQREKTGVAYMYKVDVKKDNIEFTSVVDSKPQTKKITMTKE